MAAGRYPRVAAGPLLSSLLLAAVVSCRAAGNPPVRQEPAWDTPATRALAVRACFACHSNETDWPWYSGIPPSSWLVQADVYNGRDKLNFSEWDRPQNEAREAAETVLEGEMPPGVFLLMQPQARLSPAEKRDLVRGFDATLGGGGRGDRDEGRRGNEGRESRR